MSGLPAAMLLGLVLALALMALVWLTSLHLRDASLVDRFWGAGFVLLAWAYWLSAGAPAAGFYMLVPVTAWGLRLSLYLSLRNWGHGEDARYRRMREHHGDRFPWVSLWTVFVLQGVLMWFIAMPMLVGTRYENAAELAPWLLWPGLLVWLVGLLWESVGDAQLSAFKADPANRGKVMDQGLWRYSRHPNYFGEILVWVGYFLIAAAGGGWWTVVSAALMIFLIIRVSGVTLLERSLKESRPGYADYAARTNALIPGPRRGKAAL